MAEPLPTLVETHGIEIEVPTGWVVTNKGANTTIMPTKYKGRGIDITEIDKPLTKDLATEFAKGGKLQHPKLTEGTRNGTKAIAVEGQVEIKDKGLVDVSILAVENASHGTTFMLSFVRADSDPVLVKANEQLLLSARLAGPKIALSIIKPAKKGLVGIPDDLAAQLGKVGTNMDAIFRFPRPLPLEIKQCGVVNCFYSPTTHSITVCHEFWDDTVARFKANGRTDAQANELARGTVMFAFFHEFGHALVGEFNLPITGKGEDAADELATLVLSQAHDLGRQWALAGMAWFQAMLAKGNNGVYWDEHSFNDQRMVAIACLLYGSDQKTYTPLLETLKIPRQRADRCVRDYKARLAAWNSLIEPHMRKAAAKK